jgi:hypothetical protein
MMMTHTAGKIELLKFQASGLLDDDTGSRQYSEKTLILSGRY